MLSCCSDGRNIHTSHSRLSLAWLSRENAEMHATFEGISMQFGALAALAGIPQVPPSACGLSAQHEA